MSTYPSPYFNPVIQTPVISWKRSERSTTPVPVVHVIDTHMYLHMQVRNGQNIWIYTSVIYIQIRFIRRRSDFLNLLIQLRSVFCVRSFTCYVFGQDSCEAVEDPAFSLKVSRDWKAGRTHGRTQWDFNGIWTGDSPLEFMVFNGGIKSGSHGMIFFG